MMHGQANIKFSFNFFAIFNAFCTENFARLATRWYSSIALKQEDIVDISG